MFVLKYLFAKKNVLKCYNLNLNMYSYEITIKKQK